mmetsp:Transcript_7854/g.13012  ORF Transcript_7854/g.13012 Transcript_7854/m.13012 type:complete len:341 (+) Transcript_7854:38-1060(+)
MNFLSIAVTLSIVALQLVHVAGENSESNVDSFSQHARRKVNRHVRPSLSLVASEFSKSQPHFELKDMILAKSSVEDYRGNNYYCFVFNSGADQYVSREMLANGCEWEGFLNELIRHLVKEETSKTGLPPSKLLIVDVGANLGSFTLAAAATGCHVHAFEMQIVCYTMVEMSTRMSGYADRVKVHNVPLWNETIETSYTPSYGNFGGTYLRKDSTGQMKVLSQRMDKYVTEPSVFFIKLDIEGAEERALLGLSHLVNERKIKYIAIGDSGTAHYSLLTWLYGAGYTCRNYGPAGTSNINPIDCSKPHEKIDSSCYWPTFTDLKEKFDAIKRGHINVLCFPV